MESTADIDLTGNGIVCVHNGDKIGMIECVNHIMNNKKFNTNFFDWMWCHFSRGECELGQWDGGGPDCAHRTEGGTNSIAGIEATIASGGLPNLWWIPHPVVECAKLQKKTKTIPMSVFILNNLKIVISNFFS